MAKKYTVTDGKMVLIIEQAEKGWLAVSSPVDPGLITQAKTIDEAFANAHDAQKALNESRAKLRRELSDEMSAKIVRRSKRAHAVAKA